MRHAMFVMLPALMTASCNKGPEVDLRNATGNQVSEAVNRGAALSRNHNDPLVSKYRSIAAQLAGLPPVAQSKQSGMFGLFPALKR